MSSTTSEIHLDRLTWQEFKEQVPKKVKTVILPVGTIEAHGVTPLGTDNIIPVTISEMIARDLKALVAPLVPYGITRTLLAYPGSLTVSSMTLENYITEILGSLSQVGFKRLVVMNGHGGQMDELRRAVFNVHTQHKVNITLVHWWLLCSDVTKEVFGQAGGHAGIDETACVEAVDPKLVKKERYRKNMAYTMQEGIYSVPAPGTILLYESGEGYPSFNPEKSRIYLVKVAQKVKSVILDIFKKWEQM